ncbi:MAG: hypothetical protein NTV80_23040 [Verrucomicrobia bacterium]|nr:hypothetical protein [Verrucomicrobiota bacterium]
MIENRTEGSHKPGKTGGGFPSTDWAAVRKAAFSDTEEGRAALEHLCRSYRPVIRACLASNSMAKTWRGEDVDDLTQDFLSSEFLLHLVPKADSACGQFRHFISHALRRFLLKRYEERGAQKRGGHLSDESIGEHEHLQTTVDESELQDRAWAREIFSRAARRVRSRYEQAGRLVQFEKLWALFWDDSAAVRRLFEHSAELSQNAVNQQLFRLRTSLKACLRHEVGTIMDGTPTDVDEEAAYLMRVLAKDLSMKELCDSLQMKWTPQ